MFHPAARTALLASCHTSARLMVSAWRCAGLQQINHLAQAIVLGVRQVNVHQGDRPARVEGSGRRGRPAERGLRRHGHAAPAGISASISAMTAFSWSRLLPKSWSPPWRRGGEASADGMFPGGSGRSGSGGISRVRAGFVVVVVIVFGGWDGVVCVRVRVRVCVLCVCVCVWW